MILEITLPFGKKDNVKNLVFTILINEYPLKIIELTNFIRKRYGKSVTFQAVRKATLELVNEGVLIRDEKSFQIKKEWVLEVKNTVDKLYEEFYGEKNLSKKVDSIEGEVTVFTFNSINDMMQFWQSLIDDWHKKISLKKSINCYQAAHIWEVLLHPNQERKIMTQLKTKGVKSYALTTSNTPLDRHILKFYRSIGVKTEINSSRSNFDRGYYVGTYGDLIVQTQYPSVMVKLLDSFFKKNTSLENLDLKSLSDIVMKKVTIKLTVIKNAEMAKQINQSILSQME